MISMTRAEGHQSGRSHGPKWAAIYGWGRVPVGEDAHQSVRRLISLSSLSCLRQSERLTSVGGLQRAKQC
ncbi:MAG: hypothetical protein K0R62_712, partial [Nonomuraea muscovyensis]|nr:hypothetical protein [Nonomuraea muscovyensis]